MNLKINKVTSGEFVAQVVDWAQAGGSYYACFANVHVLMEAYDSSDFSKIINGADLVLPDGMPLVWMMRLKGARSQQRVYGPTLMLQVLESAARENIPVGFYGGTPEVLNALVVRMKARCTGLDVVYSYSPPFRELSQREEDEIVLSIDQSGARILFIGLGCPRQEIWMARHRGRINAVMLGVGAAFDFHSGFKPQAPLWTQNIGLEWLFRLLTEPRRLWRRYLYHNSRFIFLAIADLLGFLR
ncbi:MAG: WecB/TagA/CpsF family glycosyltransferase [Anaerolineales bacterium]|nr:MAG: WecB/TagA/CpsF family glycosyltransferase [Anaerolineales bacterium]